MPANPEVTAADRAMATAVRKQIEKSIGPSSGWAFFNAEAVENPIAEALATVRAEAEAAHVEHHQCVRCYEAGRRAATHAR